MWGPPFWPSGSGRTGFRPAARYQKNKKTRIMPTKPVYGLQKKQNLCQISSYRL